MKRIKATDKNENPIGLRVASLVSYSRGFACALGSARVCLFVKNANDSFTRSRDIWVKKPKHSLLYWLYAKKKSETWSNDFVNIEQEDFYAPGCFVNCSNLMSFDS